MRASPDEQESRQGEMLFETKAKLRRLKVFLESATSRPFDREVSLFLDQLTQLDEENRSPYDCGYCH
jgi:hypothetical protein